MRPPTDLETARIRNLTFAVARKDRQYSAWKTIFETSDLDEALAKAESESAYERGVFVKSRSGEMLYWTSTEPDLYNSTCLELVET